MKNLIETLIKNNIEYQTNAPINSYLTRGIGGDVGLIATVTTDQQLKNLLIHLRQTHTHIPYILLGGGSNVIFPDHAPNLLAIINRTHEITPIPDKNLIKVSSGVFINDLMEWNVIHNIGGMDFLAGIPGSIGGATAVNGGAFGQSISTLVHQAEIITSNGQIKTVDNAFFGFSYRNSTFKHSDGLILTVTLKTSHEPGPEIRKKVDEKIKYRKEHHPCSNARSAGCFFKNPVVNGEKIPAGRIIEQLGLKGFSFKNLCVSEEHGNFVLNANTASFDDVLQFEKTIVDKVLVEKHIKLEREVIYISPEGKKY